MSLEKCKKNIKSISSDLGIAKIYFAVYSLVVLPGISLASIFANNEITLSGIVSSTVLMLGIWGGFILGCYSRLETETKVLIKDSLNDLNVKINANEFLSLNELLELDSLYDLVNGEIKGLKENFIVTSIFNKQVIKPLSSFIDFYKNYINNVTVMGVGDSVVKIDSNVAGLGFFYITEKQLLKDFSDTDFSLYDFILKIDYNNNVIKKYLPTLLSEKNVMLLKQRLNNKKNEKKSHKKEVINFLLSIDGALISENTSIMINDILQENSIIFDKRNNIIKKGEKGDIQDVVLNDVEDRGFNNLVKSIEKKFPLMSVQQRCELKAIIDDYEKAKSLNFHNEADVMDIFINKLEKMDMLLSDFRYDEKEKFKRYLVKS